MKKKCIIVDIDGTLANINHRRKDLLVDKDWKKFNSRMDKDIINPWCLEIINQFKSQYDIILATGRSEDFREVTLKWLKNNEVFYTKLFFRKSNDSRDDRIIKEEIFREKVSPSYDTLFVVDDRKKVVDMWREIGLVCLQCDYGDF